MNPHSDAVFILANPISGRGRGVRAAESLKQRLVQAGLRVDLEMTKGPGDARTMAADLDDPLGTLAVVGGDGTLNEVISGLTRFDVPIALLPLGTANLLGTALGLTHRPDRLTRIILARKVRRLDLGQVGSRRFVSVAGIGFDAACTRELQRLRRGPISKLSYVRPVTRTLFGHRTTPLTVIVDGQQVTDDAAWVLVCNVKEYAAYFQFTPEADPTDGEFDLCILHRHGRLSHLALFIRALCRRTGRPPAVSYPRGKRIKIVAPTGTAPYELDGDHVGETPVEIHLLRAALPVLVP
jgi:diacylglycerol kinase (ATP)